MQPKISSTFSVDPHDWAYWLDSIALNPHQHKILTQVDDRLEYLNKEEGAQEQQKGHSVQKLTLDKVIEITQKIWADPEIKRTEKRQILEGIRYIHQQKQAKYQHLFWLVRIFAKFRGVETQLQAEAREIERLETDLATLSAIPVLPKKVIQSEEKVTLQLAFIRKRMEELGSQKEDLKADEKEQWYENFFRIEKKLFYLRQNLSENRLIEFKSQFKELDQYLAEWNSETPRLKQIGKAFGRQAVQSSLQDTLNFLLEHRSITKSELERDQALFQCSLFEVKARYVKRLVKAERTGLLPSLVTAIERTWEEIKEQKQEGHTEIVEGKRVIFIPQEGEIYLKEGYISKGSYQATFIITPFQALKSEKQRGTLVILQAITEKVLQEIDEQEIDEQEDEGSSCVGSTNSEVSSIGVSQNLVNKRKATEKEDLVLKKSAAKENADKGLSSNGEEPKVKIPMGTEIRSPEFDKNKAQSQQGSSSYNEVDENCKQKGKNCLLYGKLRGIWPTHKVTTVDKQTAIIQPLAGYQLKSSPNQGRKAISLQDMCIFQERKQLEKEDQLVFLRMMRHALTGIESLHEQDVIHRDLKPENILCSEEGGAAISDLGTVCPSMVVVSLPGRPVGKIHNVEKKFLAGSPNFISPEASYYRSNIKWTQINTAVDIWATGLILWEAFSGKVLVEHPVHLAIGNGNNDLLPLKIVEFIGEVLSNKNKRGDIYNRLYRPPTEKGSLAHLIWDCTRPDPTQRPLIKEVIQRYDAWARYTEAKMEAGQIQSIQETFEDAVS
jgi:hypothetical protein